MDFINALVLLANFLVVPAISYGSQLALGAIGVTLIYGILRFANFAYGDLMAFGTMFAILFTWYFQSIGISLGVFPTALIAIPFAIIIAVIMLYIFGKKDYRLAAISFSAIISHIAFDVWLTGQIYPGSTSGFPLLSPFTVEIFRFQGLDWLYLEILAIVIVGIIAILDRKISIKNHIEK